VNVALPPEKTSLLNHFSTYKQFNNEKNKKLQGMNDLHKKSEVEKTSVKNQIQKQLIEIEKKILKLRTRRNKSIKLILKEKSWETSCRIYWSQESTRAKISSLTEELHNKIIELSTLTQSEDTAVNRKIPYIFV